MSVKAVCEDMFVHAYKHAIKSENPFEEFENTFKKLEKVFEAFRNFNNLLAVAKVYGLELPSGESFGETFTNLLGEVLREFFERHSEHFPTTDREGFIRKLLEGKKIDIFTVPPEVEDLITLITALEVDRIAGEVYTTTRIKRIIAALEE
jgi:hypothetical protein